MCTISKYQFCIKLKEAITQEEPSGVAGNHESGKICEMFCKTFKSHMAVWPELKAACVAQTQHNAMPEPNIKNLLQSAEKLKPGGLELTFQQDNDLSTSQCKIGVAPKKNGDCPVLYNITNLWSFFKTIAVQKHHPASNHLLQICQYSVYNEFRFSVSKLVQKTLI